MYVHPVVHGASVARPRTAARETPPGRESALAAIPSFVVMGDVMRGSGTLAQLAATLGSLAGFAVFASGTPALVLVPALVPAVGCTLLLAVWTRYRSETGWLIFATFMCGAIVASTLSTMANEMAQLRLTGVIGEVRARGLTPAFVAPVLEELCKALLLLVVLLVRRQSAHPLLDCLVYGVLVGLGFAVAENIHYFTLAAVQGGPGGLARSIYLRALLGGSNHALFTGMVGAGIGGLLQARGGGHGVAALVVGFVAAVTQHVVWNAWASRAITEILCGAPDPGGACRAVPAHGDLFGTVPLIAAVSTAPGLVAVTLLLRSALRSAQQSAVGQGQSSPAP